MTARRAQQPERPARDAASAKTVARAKEPTARGEAPELRVHIVDPGLRAQVIATGARLGIAIAPSPSGAPMSLPDTTTIAHALRVEVLVAETIGPLRLSPGASARAFRWLSAWIEPDAPADAPLLAEEGDGRISLRVRGARVDLGEPPEAYAAIQEARARLVPPSADTAVDLPAEAEARARAIVFGPSRTLSEPSSRRVLEAFGIGGAPWRVAENAPRAAAHARGLGYPVDLRIASPDVSPIDEPTLAIAGLRSPGEVREGFRAIAREVRRIAPEARVLGVTVAKHVPTLPRLALTLTREGKGCRVRIGLDDPIGRRLVRPTIAAAPLDLEAAAAVLARFEGREVLPSPTTTAHRALLELLVRLGRAAVVLSDAITQAELAPVAPDATNDAWLVVGARVAVRGIDAAE
jgi:hypothetical protein